MCLSSQNDHAMRCIGRSECLSVSHAKARQFDTFSPGSEHPDRQITCHTLSRRVFDAVHLHKGVDCWCDVSFAVYKQVHDCQFWKFMRHQ